MSDHYEKAEEAYERNIQRERYRQSAQCAVNEALSKATVRVRDCPVVSLSTVARSLEETHSLISQLNDSLGEVQHSLGALEAEKPSHNIDGPTSDNVVDMMFAGVNSANERLSIAIGRVGAIYHRVVG